MSKVFYFDIDGTLLPHGQKELSVETKYALRELIRLNYDVFIATGKHHTVAKKVGEELGIKNYITTNGQQVHINNELVFESKFSLEEISELRTLLEANTCTLGLQNFEANFILKNDHMEANKINECFLSVTLPIPEILEDVKEDNILQLLIFGLNKRSIDLDEKYKMFHWHDFGGDILHRDSSKANGIKQIRHLFENHESYAFGDGDNDVEMFDYVENSVAMGNARDSVKSRAKYTANKDIENGVYQFLVDRNIIEEYRG